MGKLNKSKGNMYTWCTHTWSPISGGCEHQCSYCYIRTFMKLKDMPDIDRFFPALGKGRAIFVGHFTDMFAESVPALWILRVLNHCCQYPGNTYVFQSKNVDRMAQFITHMPPKRIMGTTVETDDQELLTPVSKAPPVMDRLVALSRIAGRKFITIEPVMDFRDPQLFAAKILTCTPNFVCIGADSKGHKLREPSADKLAELLAFLDGRVEIRGKHNLDRIMKVYV
jgi:protein gp37